MEPTLRLSVSLVTARNRDVLMNVQSPHKWWSTLNCLRCSARVRHCLHSLVRVVDWCVNRLVRLICCHPSPSFTTFAFRSSEVRRLLLDLDPYGGTDPLGMFPLFLKITADVMAPRLSVVFRWLVRLGSFPAFWRQANVTPIPKGPPSSSVDNYRPISITSVLSKVFERLVSVRLGQFIERSGVLPTTQFAYRKGLGPVMHFRACPIRW